ncbi:MAG TPA: flavodoxin family protein [Candidatus Bathyarchaeia archaeon]|nr:flavodoxin family protein [Candidatus Bathyarchaeia archaeon]
MVKAIVLYNSHTGNTRKVAMKIAEGLEADCRSNRKIPDLKNYDLIVVGSWVIMGMLSFAGKRYLKRLKRKNIAGKKVALFFTSGAPDAINPMTEKSGEPKIIKDSMFAAMEKAVNKNNQVTILPERFYCIGSAKMFGKNMEKDAIDHPIDEELAQAKVFGEQLKKQLKTQ